MKVKQYVSLPHDDLDWYRKEHGGISLSATLTLLLRSYRQICTDVGATPKRVAKDAAKEVNEIVKEGIFAEVKVGDEDD